KTNQGHKEQNNQAENNDQDFTNMMNEAASMAESQNSDFDFASEDQQPQTQEQEVVPAPPENDPEPVQVPPRDKVMPQEQDEIARSEEHTSELQSRFDLVCRLLLEKKKHGPINILDQYIYLSATLDINTIA